MLLVTALVSTNTKHILTDFSFVKRNCFVMCVSNSSELENVSNNSACDVIGLVTFVGRIERVKSKGNTGKKCSYSVNWSKKMF